MFSRVSVLPFSTWKIRDLWSAFKTAEAFLPFMVRFLPRVISPLLGSKSAFISLSITMVWAPVVFAASFLSSSHRLEPLSLPGKSRLPGLNLTVTVLSPVILESVAVSEVELTPDQWSKSQPLSGVAVNSTVLPCETVKAFCSLPLAVISLPLYLPFSVPPSPPATLNVTV